jgi:hypothetical protein
VKAAFMRGTQKKIHFFEKENFFASFFGNGTQNKTKTWHSN